MNIERQKERQVEYLRRRVEDLESLVKQLVQQMPMAMMTGAGMGGGSGGGAYYADPGSTVIVKDYGTDELEVFEVLAAGPSSLGTKTIINAYPLTDTKPNLRLMLKRNRDGSFTIDNQDCPEDP